MSNLPPEQERAVTLSDVYAYEAGLAESRRESTERLEAAEVLAVAAEQALHSLEGQRQVDQSWEDMEARRKLKAALARWRKVAK